MDKSYVTLEVCPICQERTGNILLDRRLRDKFEYYTVNPASPCEKCQKKYLTKGVLLINPETGTLVVLKDSAYRRLFNVPMPKRKIVFCEEAVLEKIQKVMKTEKREVNNN